MQAKAGNNTLAYRGRTREYVVVRGKGVRANKVRATFVQARCWAPLNAVSESPKAVSTCVGDVDYGS